MTGLRELEVDPIVCDVYDATALAEAVSASEPDLVMLLAAARAADAERFIAQSIAWRPPAGGEAVDEHERLVLDAGD